MTVHIHITPAIQQIDTGERREVYCWHCRERTTRALIRVHTDSPYYEPHFEWRCQECKRDTYFGCSPSECRPIEWEPVGTELRIPDDWEERFFS